MVGVTITDNEAEILRNLATQRQRNKEANGVPTRKKDKKINDLDMHYVGMKAEFAVAKLLDIEPNIALTRLGDDGFDFVLPNNTTLDVKFSQKDLKFPPHKSPPDILVLCQPLNRRVYNINNQPVYPRKDQYVNPDIPDHYTWRDVIVVGWVSRDRFVDSAPLVNLGFGQIRMMPAQKMCSIKDILYRLREVGYTGGYYRLTQRLSVA